LKRAGAAADEKVPDEVASNVLAEVAAAPRLVGEPERVCADAEPKTVGKSVLLAAAVRAPKVEEGVPVESLVARKIDSGEPAEQTRVANLDLKASHNREPDIRRNEMMIGESNERPPAASRPNHERTLRENLKDVGASWNSRDVRAGGAPVLAGVLKAQATSVLVDVVARTVGKSVPLVDASRNSKDAKAVAVPVSKDAVKAQTTSVLVDVVGRTVGKSVPLVDSSRNSKDAKAVAVPVPENTFKAQATSALVELVGRTAGKSVPLVDANRNSKDAKVEVPVDEVRAQAINVPVENLTPDQNAIADLKVMTEVISHSSGAITTRGMNLAPSLERTL